LHHVDPNTSIEESILAMAKLVDQGLVRYIGLGDMEEKYIRQSHAIHLITKQNTPSSRE
jgi:aryl-alcohol dehydrogenase-like predicted oxidoreductase